jgi:hypothetical protein
MLHQVSQDALEREKEKKIIENLEREKTETYGDQFSRP